MTRMSATPPLRWGILGTGQIAKKFVADLAFLPEGEVVAVGSRSADTGQEFARQFGIARSYDSYEALVADPDVEAVYVATPHPWHRDHALLAIAAGKALLIEKPFTLNASQAQEIVDAARVAGTFVMEAMWSRFLPHMVRLRQLLADGAIGDVRNVTVEHSIGFGVSAGHRILDLGVGGGALLDLGIYTVSFASMILGEPTSVTAVSNLGPTGVDSQTALVLTHTGGRLSTLLTSLEATGANRAAVMGTGGRIELDPSFNLAGGLTLVSRQPDSVKVFRDGEVSRYDEPHEGDGLRHQAGEVARCVRAGLTESPILPLAETVSILRTTDEARRQIGLRYPTE
ncbi:MAG: Gfo/Idh/MocA family oxidoreductase [Actinomycetota bacterium]|nr:MAG: Gfo/Idh/MocA family oxidoreductase [Actinomycetota bacterium]